MFKHHKLFGIGPNQFRKKCDEKKYNSGIKSCSTHPHNYYFQLLGETGLIGFLLFFICYLLIIKMLIKQFYLVNIKNNKFLSLDKLFVSTIFFSNFWPIITTGNAFGSFSLNLIIIPLLYWNFKWKITFFILVLIFLFLNLLVFFFTTD